MTKEKTLSNANSVGQETQARLAGMTKEETSGNANSVVPERRAHLAGMARVGVFAQDQHGGLKRKSALGWNGEVEYSGDSDKNRTGEKRLRSIAVPKNLLTTKPRATRYVQ
ncbi:hypothetical protein, partial [Oceanithermus sp.]